jgi:hypothetical protein
MSAGAPCGPTITDATGAGVADDRIDFTARPAWAAFSRSPAHPASALAAVRRA